MNSSDILNLFSSQTIGTSSIPLVLFSVVLAFAVGLGIAAVYRMNFRGVMYSSNFTLTLVLMTLITTPVVMCIRESIQLSMGMVGALSIVRFRTAVKDPLDTAYMFWALTMGILLGAGQFLLTAVAGVAIAVLIIGIAIVNFVNFSIALTPVRLRSINTQKVFGNTNGAIRCNLIGEAMGIALLSLLLSLIVVKLFAGSAYASFIESCTKIGSDLQILAITAVVAIVTGLLSGIYPAFYATSRPPILAIKGSFALSPKGKRVRTLLIAFQFVISIVLIVFSISIHVQNRYMQRFNMGFERNNILIQQWIGSRIASQKDAFADKLKSNPAIVDVTFSGGKIVDLDKSRWGQTYKGELIAPNIFPVAPNFLSFMGIGITEGRDFIADDNRKSNFTVIFNQTAQRQYGLTVGERFGEWDIAGIARDFNFKPLQYGIEPIAFAVFGDHPIAKSWQTGTLYVKVNPANLSATLKFIRETIQEFDPDAEENLVFLDDSIGQLYQKERNLSTLILLFSLLSMLISVVGIFGLVLFETQYRRKEIGIRKIHGATVGEILRIFNGTYVRIVLACFVVATPVAYYGVKRWLENFAYRTPIHSWIFLAALIVVLSVVVAIITLRCYKTATDNPIKSIKTE